jgi:hypothetical protein
MARLHRTARRRGQSRHASFERRKRSSLRAKPEVIVKGTPRSWMLRWANAAAGWWTSAAVSAMQRQQRALLGAMKPKRTRIRRRPRRK